MFKLVYFSNAELFCWKLSRKVFHTVKRMHASNWLSLSISSFVSLCPLPWFPSSDTTFNKLMYLYPQGQHANCMLSCSQQVSSSCLTKRSFSILQNMLNLFSKEKLKSWNGAELLDNQKELSYCCVGLDSTGFNKFNERADTCKTQRSYTSCGLQG